VISKTNTVERGEEPGIRKLKKRAQFPTEGKSRRM
jgi:hypothetical protein